MGLILGLESMKLAEVSMTLACILFVIAGIATFFSEDPRPRTAVALICIGVANALLLLEARS